MFRHQLPSTCLSDKAHDHRVSDVTAHFNGCLRASKRRRFYDGLAPEAQACILRENDRITALRHRLETAQCDSTATARLRAFKQAMAQWNMVTGRPSGWYTDVPCQRSGAAAPNRRCGLPDYDDDDDVNSHIKAPIVYFKDGQPFDAPDVRNTFPCQDVAVSDLLSADAARNPLARPNGEGVVRYVHLPANNMSWVEEVVARYYNEAPPDPDDDLLFRRTTTTPRPRTRTEMLLRPEYWQGQQSFVAGCEVHARHMRPLCEGIASVSDSEGVAATSDINEDDGAAPPRNLVLFMPYLHWETDRGRVKADEIVKEVNKHMPRSISEVVNQAQQQQHHQHLHETHSNDSEAPMWAAPSPPQPQAQTQPVGDGTSLARRRALGQVLRAAATLREAMDLHAEEQLMVRYLHARPPLHPRRTLDQSYYGALKSTRARDRDQVVYRGTTPEPHDCIGADACPQCNDDIRKVPRIIMVDQLWLWVLDERMYPPPPPLARDGDGHCH